MHMYRIHPILSHSRRKARPIFCGGAIRKTPIRPLQNGQIGSKQHFVSWLSKWDKKGATLNRMDMVTTGEMVLKIKIA